MERMRDNLLWSTLDFLGLKAIYIYLRLDYRSCIGQDCDILLGYGVKERIGVFSYLTQRLKVAIGIGSVFGLIGSFPGSSR